MSEKIARLGFVEEPTAEQLEEIAEAINELMGGSPGQLVITQAANGVFEMMLPEAMLQLEYPNGANFANLFTELESQARH